MRRASESGRWVFARRRWTAPAVQAADVRHRVSADTPLGGRLAVFFLRAVGGPILHFPHIGRPVVPWSSVKLTECWCLLFSRHYQDMLPAEGLGRTHGPKIPIQQMFSDYVHTRGLSNWKFWIVSLTTVSWYTAAMFMNCHCHRTATLVLLCFKGIASFKYIFWSVVYADVKMVFLDRSCSVPGKHKYKIRII